MLRLFTMKFKDKLKSHLLEKSFDEVDKNIHHFGNIYNSTSKDLLRQQNINSKVAPHQNMINPMDLEHSPKAFTLDGKYKPYKTTYEIKGI